MVIDEQIVKDCIAGKRQAQRLLFDTFAPLMLGVCMRYCRDRDEAEDILQEGFIKVFQNIHSFRGEGSLAGWIKRVIVNHAINYINKRNKIVRHEKIDEIRETEILDMNEPIEFPDEYNPALLLKLIQELPVGYRTVFNLHIFEDYGHKEIAAALGISENTSKTQLFKARRWLKNKIEENRQKKNLK
ncbi:MAG: sigma-70 family RNA polymerase sigma factor [Bacteroidetes bacterium]|nr:sigma-70 family RNA polymerase sigma factor [Bacteroidota bacterium]